MSRWQSRVRNVVTSAQETQCGPRTAAAGRGGAFAALFCATLLALAGGGARRVEAQWTPVPSAQRAALIALYTSTNGDAWTRRDNWRDASGTGFAAPGTECTWYGVTCNAVGTAVTGITLPDNNLAGTLPASLGDVGTLVSLDLSHNTLSGPVPASLGGIPGLQVLVLGSNRLDGSIPAELGSLSALQVLDLSWNALTGSIPVELGSLGSLTWLDLQANQLTGSIPVELGGLASLQTLDLSWNRALSGGIPAELGGLAKLTSLHISGTNAGGTIPPELGNLARLKDLTLTNDDLMSNIPAELGNLTGLEVLDLSRNYLGGPLPLTFSNLTGLKTFNVSYNTYLYPGLVPWWIEGMTRLTTLGLAGTSRTNTIPAWLGNLKDLVTIDLTGNDLTGAIPPELGGLPALKFLYLGANQLDGPLPPELGGLATLQYLVVSGNGLTGSIPPELGNLAALRMLSLDANALTGAVPSALGGLAELTQLNLASNALAGDLPVSLQDLAALSQLDLRWNALTSTDPALTSFLDLRQAGSNWQATQTVAPAGAAAGAAGATSVPLTWTPVSYTADAGGYRVSMSASPGGPFDAVATLTSKYTGSYEVTGLAPSTTYYFVVESYTGPHAHNANQVWSRPGAVLMAATHAPRTLTVALAGSLGGRVTSMPAGIDCGDTCAGYFAQDETVLVTPGAGAGSVFGGWSGACSGTGPCSVVMDVDKAVTAMFFSDATSQVLTVTPDGTGSGTVISDPVGIGCPSGCSSSFAAGTVVTLTASVAPGDTFLGWGGACAGTSTTCQVTMDQARSVSVTFQAPAVVPRAERDALVDLYNATGGASWTHRDNWRNAADTDFADPGTECSWYGVTCNAEGTAVAELDLSWNNLAGTLPSSLADLADLTSLKLQTNALSGVIPTGLGQLTALATLDLSRNQLSGSIPAELGNLTGLTSLLLAYDTGLDAGAVPAWVEGLTGLVNLDLSGTNRTGAIPAWLGSLDALETLALASNQLTGAPPAELGGLAKLKTLDLSWNGLDGSLPPELGAMTSLTTLNLSQNRLTGSLPAALGGLSNLTYLSVRSNRLSGALPAELGNLTSLESLWLSYNGFDAGPVPSWLQNLTALTGIGLDGTNRTGVLPVWLAAFPAMQSLGLASNQLAGEIPPQLGTMPALRNLDLSYNQLGGGIPAALGGLPTLWGLHLDHNHLTGAIPAELGALTSLQTLELASNGLSGAVPGTLANLAGLSVNGLDLRWNALSSADAALAAFLGSRQTGGDWRSTQTVAPADTAAGSVGGTAVTLTWTPVTYTADPGGYVISRGTSPGGPFQQVAVVAGKDAASHEVAGLDPSTTYYFAVASYTDPHVDNPYAVTSDPAPLVEATTTSASCDVLVAAVTISGAETDRSCGTITVGPDVSVTGTGELTLRAARAVAIGNGFSVSPGGRLTVALDPALAP